MNYEKIPGELRQYPQWVCWKYEERGTNGKATKVPYGLDGKLAKVDDSGTWTNFDSAVSAVGRGEFDGIGFVLTANDPFALIDLDEPKTRNSDPVEAQKEYDAQANRQRMIFEKFESYAERSPSGNGLHIIVKGAVKNGRRRESIEVYSDGRYMTMTGDVYRERNTINDCNEVLNVLWTELGVGREKNSTMAGHDEPATDSDDDVCDKAASAINGEKFIDLYQGRWDKHYSSQSEADFALVNIIAFYTHNREQITRIFRQSALGQRSKARRSDYMNYMLNRCFDNLLPPVDMDHLRNLMSDALAAKPAEQSVQPLQGFSFDARSIDPGTGEIMPVPQPINPDLPEMQARTTGGNQQYMPPPGLLGDIAEFIYRHSPRPVREIALAGAIGLMSGIAGRAYNISRTGLNQYVMLLAPTGSGKEAIASGISTLMTEVLRIVPSAATYMGPSEIASPQALQKFLGKKSNCFASVIGEVGILLSGMVADNAPDHKRMLMRMLLDLYSKSGKGQILPGSIYSNADNNAADVKAPAVTLIGESTPEEFYRSLDESMIASGLLPRFSIIEYNGPRVPQSRNRLAQPPKELVEQMANLCNACLMMDAQHDAVEIELTTEAQAMADKFNEHCDAMINGSDREVFKQLWNRVHLKTLRLAGVVAVGINQYQPVVTIECMEWAINLVLNDVRNIAKRFELGMIGGDDEETQQFKSLAGVINTYFTASIEELKGYVSEPQMFFDRVIPLKYLSQRTLNQTSFRKARMGATPSLKARLKTLIESGDLVELPLSQRQKYGQGSAMCYMVANPSAFGL